MKNFITSRNPKNPFEQKCKNCTKNIWDKITKNPNELNSKCSYDTFIWIEKFKDDNY